MNFSIQGDGLLSPRHLKDNRNTRAFLSFINLLAKPFVVKPNLYIFDLNRPLITESMK